MSDLVELRGDVPEHVIAVIDAVVQSTPGASRMSVVREILDRWARQKVHEATLVGRVVRGHGFRTEAEGKQER